MLVKHIKMIKSGILYELTCNYDLGIWTKYMMFHSTGFSGATEYGRVSAFTQIPVLYCTVLYCTDNINLSLSVRQFHSCMQRFHCVIMGVGRWTICINTKSVQKVDGCECSLALW